MAMAAARSESARAGWSLECGLRRSAPRTVGTRRLTVLACCLGLRWRRPRGVGAWGLARPIVVFEDVAPPASGGEYAAGPPTRWWPVPDVSLLALGAALGLLVWLLRVSPRRRQGR
jgi:hypothetical protein